MALKLDSVTVSFAEKTVLKDFSFTFPQNGFIGMSGPSGCGKTTLLKTIAGLIVPDKGCVLGTEDSTFSMVFAEDVLLDWLTVEENIRLVIPKEVTKAVSVNDLLEMVELAGYEKTYPAELSKGMKRRVAIARALAIESDVLLLDEPTSHLDKRLAETLMGKIASIRKDRLTFCISHDLDILQNLSVHTYLVDGLPLVIL